MTETASAVNGAAAATVRQTYILFLVASTTYAVRSHDVLHVEMLDHVTPVPNAPECVEGVVFSRGQVVPVVNLRTRFGFERAELDLRSRLLVVQSQGRQIGLLADEAREFVALDDGAIQPPNQAIGGLSGHYLEGVATIGERIVMVLNVREVVETVPTAAA